MKSKLTLALASLMFLTFSCNKEDVFNGDQIEDASGLRIDLEWSTGGSTSQSIADVDLELYLMKGLTEVDESENSSSFEVVSLSHLYSDATYTAEYAYYSGRQDVAYSLYVTGLESGETIIYTGTIYKEESTNFELLDIQKEGNRYMLTQLD